LFALARGGGLKSCVALLAAHCAMPEYYNSMGLLDGIKHKIRKLKKKLNRIAVGPSQPAQVQVTPPVSATVQHKLRRSFTAAFDRSAAPRLGQAEYQTDPRSPWNIMAADASFNGHVTQIRSRRGLLWIIKFPKLFETTVIMGNSDHLTAVEKNVEPRSVNIEHLRTHGANINRDTVEMDQGSPEWVKVAFLSPQRLSISKNSEKEPSLSVGVINRNSLFKFGEKINIKKTEDGVAENDVLVSPLSKKEQHNR